MRTQRKKSSTDSSQPVPSGRIIRRPPQMPSGHGEIIWSGPTGPQSVGGIAGRTAGRLGTTAKLLSCSALACMILLTVFCRNLSGFQAYDDMGYLMITVKHYLDGVPIYSGFYTQYGPAYYIVQSLIHARIGLPLTHDTVGLTTVGVAAVLMLIIGFSIWRFSGKFLPVIISLFSMQTLLLGFSYELGHPQELTTLLSVALLALFAVRKEGALDPFTLAGTAVLIAAAALTKINIGIFLFLGLGTALAGMTAGNARLLMKIIFSAAAAALPFALIRGQFSSPESWNVAACVECGIVTSIFLAYGDGRDRIINLRSWILLVQFIGLAAVVMLLPSLLNGVSPQMLLHGLVFQHLEFADAAPKAFPTTPLVPVLIAASMSLAWCYRRRRHWGDWLKPIYGIQILGLILFVELNWAWRIGVIFAWIPLCESWGRGTFAVRRPAIKVAVFASLFLSLQLFPVAGSQVGMSCFGLYFLALLCLADSLDRLPQLSLPRELTAAATRLALACVVIWQVGETLYHGLNYRNGVPLQISGATLFRLPAEQADQLNRVAAVLSRERGTFITMPGMASLYFWSHKDPPTTINVTAWMYMLDNASQSRIVADLKRKDVKLAVQNQEVIAFWQRGRPLPDRPLIRYINSSFVRKSSIGDYEILQRQEAAAIRASHLQARAPARSSDLRRVNALGPYWYSW